MASIKSLALLMLVVVLFTTMVFANNTPFKTANEEKVQIEKSLPNYESRYETLGVIKPNKPKIPKKHSITA